MEQALAIQKERGNDAVQEALQAEIQRTKKMESEIAVLRRKVEAASKEKEAAAAELRTTRSYEVKLKEFNKNKMLENKRLQEDYKKQVELVEKEYAELESKLDANASEVVVKLDEQLEEKLKVEAENVELTKKVEELQKTFEGQIDEYNGELKAKDTECQLLQNQLRKQLELNQSLATLAMTASKNLEELVGTEELSKQQVMIYETRYGDFEEVLKKAEAAFTMTDEQEAALKSKMGTLEVAKKDYVERKAELEKQLNSMRAKHRDLKKALTQTDKQRAVLETKCREAQRKNKA